MDGVIVLACSFLFNYLRTARRRENVYWRNVFYLAMQHLFETFFDPISIKRFTHEMRKETHLVIHV
jgi:hypothetical protein